jgi:hypothetical protein
VPPSENKGVRKLFHIRSPKKVPDTFVFLCFFVQFPINEGIFSTKPTRRAKMSVAKKGENKPMQSIIINHDGPSEVTILARVLGNEEGTLPPMMARYLLNRGFSEGDKARMHDLAVRNQDQALSADEKEELLAYAKAGTLLSILKSRARRVLRSKVKKRTVS